MYDYRAFDFTPTRPPGRSGLETDDRSREDCPSDPARLGAGCPERSVAVYELKVGG